MGVGAALREQGRSLWRWFFPPRVALPEGTRRVLATLFPGLDLGAVTFHLGLPHALRLAGAVAITLPAVLAPRRTRIYVAPHHWQPESVNGLGTLAHEAYHALQVQEAGWGWGPFRPFLLLYLACAAANGFRYKGHPLEEDAYLLAGKRRSRFEATFAAAGATALESESGALAALAASSSELRFWRKMAASTPVACRCYAAPPDGRERSRAGLWLLAFLGALPVAAWLLLWTVGVALVWLGRLLVEGLGAAAAGLVWGAGTLLAALEGAFSPRPRPG